MKGWISSRRVALRTERVSDEAKRVNAYCLPLRRALQQRHLLAMRRVSYSFRYLCPEVLYQNSIPVCSSLEKRGHIPRSSAQQKITRIGYRAVYGAKRSGYKTLYGGTRERQLYRDDRPGILYRCDSVCAHGRLTSLLLAGTQYCGYGSGNLDPAILPLIHHETRPCGWKTEHSVC